MTTDELDAMAGKLSEAQRKALLAICRTNGGGVRVRCKIDDAGVVVPSHGPTRKLFEKGLVQGKSGAYETIVHTRDGLAVRQRLQEVNDG